MRTSTATSAALLALALLLGAAGCGSEEATGTAASDDTTSAASAGSTQSPASPEPSASSSPAEPEDDDPPFSAKPADGGYGSGNGLGLTDVQVASHDGYDRVVFDLDGKGSVGWHAEWVKDPTSDGSGDPVELEGDVYLQVVLRGMGLPFDTGIEEYGDSTTRVPGAGAIAQVAPGGVFEGDQLAYVGVTGAERPFRVFTLSNPTRLVVDVQTD